MEMKPMKTIKHKAFFDGEVVYNASRVGNALYWDDGKNFDLFAFKQQAPAVLLDLSCCDYRRGGGNIPGW
jgi:hypothetical protein